MSVNWHSVFFLLFAVLSCGFALAVVFSSHIVRMALYLILSLGATSGLFFLAGADFVGAMQLLIYVGGTLVLLIFGVMLTAQGPFVRMKTPAGEWLMGLFAGGALLALLLQAAFRIDDWQSPAIAEAKLLPEATPTATPLGMALLGVRVDGGQTGYLLPFEIISVHLLVVLIGAAYLARAKKRRA